MNFSPMLLRCKVLCCLFLAALSYLKAGAQVVENTINLYGYNFPAEKIHVHFDKESYLPGETIWFKAYLFGDDLPSTRSTNFYATLYNEQGKMVQQVLCPIFNSSTDGHFELPDTLQSKQLICRAYTSWMTNFDSSFYFSKAIRIISNDAVSKNTDRTVSFQFFPEGGDIIEGDRNSIAFKANYSDGLPFNINGVLKKQETGEVLMPVTSLHDGMGRFDILPLPNERYYAEWTDNNGKLQQTWLPVVKQTGVSLKGVQQKNQFFYNVINRSATDTLYILGYMYQKVVYKARLSLNNGERYTGFVPLDSFPTGILQLTVFNGAWQPVAERISFVNHNEYALNSSIIYREVNTQRRGRNVIEIQVQDSIPANMSLSITDADISEPTNNTNIYSNLLLSGDLRGYIHQPAYYFSRPADSVLKTELDLVMLTHGWRRYNWDDMRAGKMPQLRYPSDDYLTLYGQVSKMAMDKMQNVLEVNMIIKTKDSSNVFYQTKPDKAGFIREDGIVFYDTARVFFSFNKNKELNNQLVFRASNNTIDQPLAIDNYSRYFLTDTTGASFKPTTSLFNYYLRNKANQALNEKTLERVTVKSGGWHNWKNNPLVKMDERYASGMFTGGANAFSFDVMHDDMAEANYDIYNYLSNRIPGLFYKLSRDLAEGKVFTYQFDKSVTIYIDEHWQENSVLSSLSISDIAYVKLIDHFMGEGERSGTALAIYLKKGDDLNNRRPSLTDLGKVSIAGYTPIKEFYSPDYSVSNTAMGTDARTTLYWQPYILTNSTHLKVPISFYNNDFTRKLRVVLEGMNDAGKMIHLEKIIE